MDHYLAEGVDRWRRKVVHEGEDPDQLLEECIASAEELQVQLGRAEGSR